jgi:serine phosphatase RsbU (regulator of sigma subunit)
MVAPSAFGVCLAVIDGLGHGQEAAFAATLAASVLRAHPDDPIEQLIGRCHEALIGTRGVVMSLAVLDCQEQTMTWLGVGNVQAVLFRANPTIDCVGERLVVPGGVVGSHLPPARTSQRALRPGDTLILATDGIHERFADTPPRAGDPQRVADRILADYGLAIDDALVLVARFLGIER